MVDGQSAYKVTIHGTPVKLQATTALGSFMQQSFMNVLDKIGLMPNKWF